MSWGAILSFAHDTRSLVVAWAGRFTFGLSLAAAGSAVVAAVLLFLRNGRGYPWVLILTIVASIAALVFVLTPPDMPAFSRGFYLFWAGIGLTLLGTLAPTVMPDSGLATDISGKTEASTSGVQAAGRTAIPACPTCSAPMQWVAVHEKFFCQTCRVYV